jgi:ABC-type branched-subunit amino acid transport system ATPase component
MRNLYIIGPQSTGKTNLVNALEKTLELDADKVTTQQTLVIHEVARTVSKEKGFHRDDITTSPKRAFQLQQHILKAQHNAEITACASSESS